MKIISYNVNGIRDAERKGFSQWLQAANPDVICLQEIKATEDQIDQDIYKNLGYHCYWYPAEKKGYSGTAILSKTKPDTIVKGCGIAYADAEGRVIRADFGKLSVFSTYFPSGSSGDIRQTIKMQFLSDFQEFINQFKKDHPNLIINGDVNICHKPIDIHDPIRNATSSGFLPEEREWVTQFLESGFVDCFREFNHQPHQYTWWSYRANARNNNKGWRIDYNLASLPLQEKLIRVAILPDAKHSDHCPILVELDW